MSAATSPGTGLAYGLRRVCAAWGMARSSFYAMTSGQHAEQPPAKRRGPKPAISDQALLVAIEADLEASPWEGEGYRKVWARLRVCRDIRVARKRVLRLMRENNLLSPHRCRRRGGNPHDGEIITHAPNLMWGTDGVRVFTVDDGWVISADALGSAAVALALEEGTFPSASDPGQKLFHFEYFVERSEVPWYDCRFTNCRLHVDRRDQPHIVAELQNLPAPVVGARTGLHRHHASLLRAENVQQPLPAQLPAERDRAVRPSTMKLKAALRQINRDDGNLFHGCLLLQGVELQHHLGTCRCRREEASTPSFLRRRAGTYSRRR